MPILGRGTLELNGSENQYVCKTPGAVETCEARSAPARRAEKMYFWKIPARASPGQTNGKVSRSFRRCNWTGNSSGKHR